MSIGAECSSHSFIADVSSRVEGPDDEGPRDAIVRGRAYARGELDSAGEIRRRFVAGRAAALVTSPGAIAAARSAAQASGVAHMGAHALGAAAYAVKSVSTARPDGEDAAGPFVAGGLLARGILGSTIRTLQTRVAVDD